MANLALSPTMSMKLKSRNCANKIRHGSPKLQEVLRERCRQRMRERRDQLFNRNRFGAQLSSMHLQSTLTEIVREELDNLSTTDFEDDVDSFFSPTHVSADPEEELQLESDILAEEEQWILQEYEQMSKEEAEFLSMYADEMSQVMCPICQKSILKQELNVIACKACNLRLTTCVTLNDMVCFIDKSVNNHSAICTSVPGFMLLPENDNVSLYMICNTCSTLNLIV